MDDDLQFWAPDPQKDLSHLQSDFERAEYLVTLLINRATGLSGDDKEYKYLRNLLLKPSPFRALVPDLVRKNRDLDQFWQFIQPRHSTYKERRSFLRDEFEPLLRALESESTSPNEPRVSEVLSKFSDASVKSVWDKALERSRTDPEGAITSARSLLESTCKHILEEAGEAYEQSADLPDLYRRMSVVLKLAPSQHTEGVFKQILGGCSSIVIGLGTLRNRVSDAHGKGKRPVKPAARHAELAVNLAGSLCVFLIDTWRSHAALESQDLSASDEPIVRTTDETS